MSPHKTDTRNATMLGIDYSDAQKLRRAALTLHGWYEQECGNANHCKAWGITRDEETGKPYRETSYYSGGKNTLTPIADREAGAIRRIDKVCKLNGLHYYLQTDCRGGTLYVSKTEPLHDENYQHGHFIA